MIEMQLVELNARLQRIEGRIDQIASHLQNTTIIETNTVLLAPTINEVQTYGDPKQLAKSDDLDLRFASFHHSWHCNPFNYCESEYSATVFVIDKNNGSKVSWNAIETAVKLSSDNDPIDWNHRGEWYRHQSGGSDAFVGFGRKKEGRDVEIWGLAKFYYASGGWAAWRWFSRA
jgi:hypothetical protein